MNIGILDKNSDGYKRLEVVAKFIELKSDNKIRCEVQDIYFDLGAGIKWTTIVAYRTYNNNSWQMLYPRHWGDIMEVDLTELHDIADGIVREQCTLIFRY